MRVLVVALFVFMCVIGIQAQGGDVSDELANLNFANIIGSPLIAVIDAQAQAARTTMDFVDELAFRTETDGSKHIVMASFVYEQLVNGSMGEFNFRVPFLTMVPVPYIEIQEISLVFNVKLSSVESFSTDTTVTNTTQTKRSLWKRQTTTEAAKAEVVTTPRTQFKGTVSSQQQTRTSGTVKRDYELEVRVRATQAETPRGAVRMLDLLEDIIQRQASD